jgi:putative ABC transport system substrate-binding protein
VIWTDIGDQAADKAMQILQGTAPGDLPWEYPRKYNLVFNLQAAKDRGITIPPALISSAYRVYTDYKGNFVGQKQ